jgi:ADP-ribose pyrophosphatase YjhB (NUDIX family)
MSVVCCYDEDGQLHLVAPDTLVFAPAVYGIFIEDQRILLLQQQNGLYAPPGRLVAFNESPNQVIRHYFRRLAEATLDLGPLLVVEEQYRWLNGRAHRITALYYGLERPSTASIRLNETLELPSRPLWVDLLTLQRHHFQFGFNAVMAGITHNRAFVTR